MENVRTQNVMRCASKQCNDNYQILSWTINAGLMTFEAEKSINLISKSGCPILDALKINKQYSQMITTASGVYIDVCILYTPTSF